MILRALACRRRGAQLLGHFDVLVVSVFCVFGQFLLTLDVGQDFEAPLHLLKACSAEAVVSFDRDGTVLRDFTVFLFVFI